MEDISCYRIACVGKRKVSFREGYLCRRIGHELARIECEILSGNAQGADQNFAMGANERDPYSVRLFLPWAAYNRDSQHTGNSVTVVEDLWKPREDTPNYVKVAQQCHPAWENTSDGSRQLLARNALIASKCDMMIALPDHKKRGAGGTGHAMRCASYYEVPIFDLTKDEDLTKVLELIDHATSTG